MNAEITLSLKPRTNVLTETWLCGSFPGFLNLLGAAYDSIVNNGKRLLRYIFREGNTYESSKFQGLLSFERPFEDLI